MKAQDVRTMDDGAIQADIDKTRRELLDLRCQVALGEEVHPHRIRGLRRDLARMLTVQSEKKAAEGGAA